MLLAACGKKGPPLTPYVLVPSAPTMQATRRSGADVYVQVVVPATNLDGSKPAAVARIEVYGVTAMTPPPRTRFLDIATLVGTVPVAPAGEPGDAVAPAPDPESGALHGAMVTIRDTLTADTLTPRELPLTAEAARARAAMATAAAAAPANVLRRFYMAIAFSPRNRPGPPSEITELPVTVLPPAPRDLQLVLTESTVGVQWDPSGGLLGWLFERALPLESPPPSLDLRPPAVAPPAPTDWLPGPTRYNVYRDISPDPLAFPRTAPPAAWQVVLPAPMNPAPVTTVGFDDPIALDDRERCYHVRALRGGVESEPSPRRCMRAVDIFPPVAPTSLQAVPSSGAINLLWDPNVEEDLGGYIVLRSEAGSATLLPLTSTPIRDPRFSDRTVKPGVRYTYEVRAVDDRVPVPNTSAPAEVTESAR